MGFFKKLGKSLKGVTKSISLKNLKRVATGNIADVGQEVAGRLVKGVSNEFTKKAHKPAQNLVMQNDALEIASIAKQNPNIRDILTGALGGAMTGAGSVLSESQTVQQVGAKAVDNVAMTWLKNNWLKLVGGITAGTLLIWGLMKLLKPKRGGRR